jgi:phosphonate transport system substrate-binding protein
VGLDAFETMVELNPQIGKELMVLMESPPFLDNVIGFRKGYDKEWQKELVDTGLKLHEDPEGQQVLMLFHRKRLTPFKSEYLDSLRKLRKDYERLKAKR